VLDLNNGYTGNEFYSELVDIVLSMTYVPESHPIFNHILSMLPNLYESYLGVMIIRVCFEK